MKNKNKKSAYRILIILVIVVLILSLGSVAKTLLSLSDEAVISIVISVLEAGGLLVSLVIAIKQLDDSKEIARADFLVELNKTFTESQGNMDLYTALQDCVDHKCYNSDVCDADSVCKLNFPKVVVSNYLTFFETIYLLERNGVITFEMLDDLFAYRFFLAIHSRFVQQAKLATQPENFKNIFCLEYEWMLYRKNKAHKIDSEDSVFRVRKLENLMKTDEQKAVYAQWIKECRKFK